MMAADEGNLRDREAILRESDLPLNLHPVAFRASGGVEPIPKFGPPAVRVFRLRSE
jgi:hypothetical protein